MGKDLERVAWNVKKNMSSEELNAPELGERIDIKLESINVNALPILVGVLEAGLEVVARQFEADCEQPASSEVSPQIVKTGVSLVDCKEFLELLKAANEFHVKGDKGVLADLPSYIDYTPKSAEAEEDAVGEMVDEDKVGMLLKILTAPTTAEAIALIAKAFGKSEEDAKLAYEVLSSRALED